MNLRRVPGFGEVMDAGADNRVFDALLVVGPWVIVLLAVAGRSVVTEAIALGYLVLLIGNTLYRAARED